MRLSSKHEQKILTYGDFSGGLNTTTVPEMIAQNQVARCVNMEFNRSTGSLQTCSGSATIFKAPNNFVIIAVFYDPINNQFLVIDADKNVYKSPLTDLTGLDPNDLELVGVLTGDVFPMAVPWEFGLLVSSGGNLQYWNGLTFDTLKYSPAVCNGVFVKNGRVYVWYDYTLQCSGVGDETWWTTSSSDDSSSQWLDIGYKEGESDAASILGVTALSADIVVLKNDGKVYRVSGEYPDWSVKEITRFGKALNSHCYCAVQDGVFILDRNNLVYLQPTQVYGDVKPQNMAVNVKGMLNDLDLEKTHMDFIPSLNQIWITSRGNDVIVFDLTFNAFTERSFNHRVEGVVTDYLGMVLLVRSDKVTRLLEGMYIDEEYSTDRSTISWNITCRTDASFNEHLLKKIRMSYAPQSDVYTGSKIITAKGKINIAIPPRTTPSLAIGGVGGSLLVGGSTFLVNPSDTQFVTQKMIHRDITLDMKLEGENAPIMINRIDCGIAEVR